MNKKGFTLVEILLVVVILGILAAIVIPQFDSTGSTNDVIAAEKSYKWSSYRWSHPFDSAEEFRKSDSYSMVWISLQRTSDSKNIWRKKFLIAKAREVHRDYGRMPYLLEAIRDVKEKGYTIVSKQFFSSDHRLADPGHIDSLLLEVKPPKDPGGIGKRHP